VSVSVMTDSGDDRVMIAIDPHKASWTAAAVDGSLQLLATIRVPVSREGYRALRGFARRWPKTGEPSAVSQRCSLAHSRDWGRARRCSPRKPTAKQARQAADGQGP
jgi:hypothetical protein